MAEIATWSAILNKTGLGKTSNECPTKAELLALNNGKDSNVDKVIVISNAASYGNNECVKLEDINAEQWIYTFQWDQNGNPSFNAPATGGTYPFGSYASNRVKQVNGVNTTISQSLANDVTKTSEGSWYTTDYDGNKGRIVPNNTSTNSKSITVTWTQKYSGKTLQATFTQAAGRKVYSSWSYNCRVDKTSFSYSGGQSNVTAKSASRTYTWNGQGSSYTESETATVRVSSPASISGNSISIPSNSGSARNFTVTFDFPTATDQTLTISQGGGQVTYVDHLSIDPTTKNVSGSGQTFDVIVNANYDRYLNGVWQGNIKSQYTNATVVIGSSSDITITRTSTGCSIKVAPNPNEGSSRTYVVEFTYDSATPVRLTITQNEAVVSYPSDGYYLGQSRSSSGFTTSDLNVTNGDRDGGSFTVYYKSYRTKYVNGSQAGLEPVTPNIAPGDFWLNTYIDPRPNGDNVYTVEVRYQANNRNTERSTRITGSNGSAHDVYVDFTQDPADIYELYFNNPDGSGYYTDFTFNSPGNGYAGNVARLTSALNGQHLPVDSVEIVETTNMNWCIVASSENNSPFMLVAAIAENGPTKSRDTKQVYRQKATGKLATINIHQARGEYPSFRLELSLNISNGNDQDTWGLFDTANMPHTSDFMYDMSLIREGIIVDSVEGKITVNSLQSTTKDRGIGDNVYVWAYNSVRGLWLSIGNFRIEEGNNTHHWDVSWPT